MSAQSERNSAGFSLVFEICEFFERLPADWCMAGGWALDLFQEKVTRKHSDIDICVFTFSKIDCVGFFLERGWRVEAKLGRGFVRVPDISKWSQAMPYFFAIAPGATFLPPYIDERGDRKLHYRREEQLLMDFVEVYFPNVENGSVVYIPDAKDGLITSKKDHPVRRAIDQAILRRLGVKYLAPELIFLHKADWPKKKDLEDLQRVWPYLSDEQQNWLRNALRLTHPTHFWFKQPPLSN